MSLTNCPDCGKPVSDAAPSCPSCGSPTQTQREVARGSRALKVAQLIGACTVLIGLGLALTSTSTEMQFWIGAKLCLYGGICLIVATGIAWWRKR